MTQARSGVALWGGVECTVARIGDRFRDQVAETGHADRTGDLDAIAALGIEAVRYPILWETIAPEHPDGLDFSWHDARLERLRELGVEVIGGLVHHGSGPPYTHLLDPGFPAKLADYAQRVARRYPWIKAWTPINEPLTTARFSCLYGHWYPHRRELGATYQALVNQCLATATAMAAIRTEIPDATLLATEDLGKTFATAPLVRQARHENARRWLSFDLLCGRVSAGHDLYASMRTHVDEASLELLATGVGRPDLIGVNHYLTSERFLDHRTARYPSVPPGSNGRDTYVDVEAVRISSLRNQLGPAKRLREAWDRYGIPIVVSEVHHGCTREEQVRWLKEVWDAAVQERSRGADIRAITLWSLFGAMDWRSLLTREDKCYDVGAFDARAATPRPTFLAKAAAKLGAGEPLDHPALDLPGWWKRPGRCYGRASYDTLPRRSRPARPLLITGATGTLGRAFGRICSHRGLAHVLTSRTQLDIVDERSIAAAIERYRPWAIINAAGFVRTWEADERAEECLASNAVGAERLARACNSAGIPFVTFSSDLVFDGRLGRPYLEGDDTAPAGTYGRSKAEAEQRVAAADADALIIRTSAFFGPWDRYNFLFKAMANLTQGNPVVASDTSVITPTYVPDLVHASLDLLLDEESGIWHVTNQGSISWHDLALEAATRARVSPIGVRRGAEANPTDTSLISGRCAMLRPLDQAIADFVEQSEPMRELLDA